MSSLRRATTALIISICAGVSGFTLSKKPVDRGRVAVGIDQRVERLNEVPGRAVDGRFEAGVNVMLRTASPLLAGGNQFQFDHAFGAE